MTGVAAIHSVDFYLSNKLYIISIFLAIYVLGSHAVNGVAVIHSVTIYLSNLLYKNSIFLAIFVLGSHAVNGVAAIHSDLIKKTLFKVIIYFSYILYLLSSFMTNGEL